MVVNAPSHSIRVFLASSESFYHVTIVMDINIQAMNVSHRANMVNVFDSPMALLFAHQQNQRAKYRAKYIKFQNIVL